MDKDITIINLSNKKLTDAEISLLNKGLKFTPTPKLGNTQELHEDSNEFNRKLKLAEFFDGTEDQDISLVRNKSNFIPPSKRNDALDEFINTVEKFPKTPIQSNVKNIVRALRDKKKVPCDLCADLWCPVSKPSMESYL